MQSVRRRRIRFATVGLMVSSLFAVACSGSGASSRSFPAFLPDELLSPNQPQTWNLSVHCGAGVFSYQINGKLWRTVESGGHVSWMPAEWGDTNRGSGIAVVLEINSAGDELRATHADRTVVYTPTELSEADPCD